MSLFNSVLLIMVLMITAACEGDAIEDPNSGSDNDSYINWKSVPSYYNPKIENVTLFIRDLKTLDINLFEFKKDVVLNYSSKLPKDSGQLSLYTVRASNSRKFLTGVNLDRFGDTLKVRKHGEYSCAMSVRNKSITNLEGACYVKVVVTLPAGSETEVYNLGKRMSEPFHPMPNPVLLVGISQAYGSQEKFAVIDEYLESYRIAARRPVLTTAELGQIVQEFGWGDEKLRVLSKLHLYVRNRANLEKMIDENFSSFDREKARQIVGI